MKALLVVAHGSRREASNEEVRQLCRRIRTEDGGKSFGRVEAAFLELAHPLIPEGIGRCIAGGAEEVVVMPYFLSSGRHVSEDIPAEVEKVRARHPHVAIRLVPHLGAHDAVAALIMQLAGGWTDGNTDERPSQGGLRPGTS